HADHGCGRDGDSWNRALRLASWGGPPGRVPTRRLELRGPHEPRRRPRVRRDPRAQLLLQRVLRGSDGVGGVCADRPRGGCSARGGGGVIEAWRRVLVLAPHTDDGEFGCGGTMARLSDAGAEIRYVAFSIATRSLPQGSPPRALAR